MKALAMLVRESRGSRGRLIFFAACLASGVAAVVAVAGLSDGVQEAVRRQARDLLAADVVVESRKPLPAGFETELGAQRTEVVELSTLVARVPVVTPDDPATGSGPTALGSRLVELKSVDGEFPYFGRLQLSPDQPLSELLAPDTVVCARELLAGLGLAVGDEILLGGERFRIAGEVLAEPDRLGVGFTLGPRVFVSRAGLDRTPLLGFGSRVEHKALLKLGADQVDVAGIAARLRLELPDAQVETAVQGQPALRRGIERTESFLGLVALLSLLVGGIGVAQTVSSWLAGRQESIALLKCLGLRPRQVLLLYVAQTLLLAGLGSLVGAIAGLCAQGLLPLVLDGLPPDAVRLWQPAALLRGLALGVGVALLFALPPLLSILAVPPALVLRREAGVLAAKPWPRRLAVLVLAGGVCLAAYVQSGSWERALSFAGGLVVAALLLWGAAALLVRLAGWAPRRVLPLGLRYGVAALARPQAGTRGAVLALGLGVVAVLALELVRGGLVREMRGALPIEAPTTFLADIQPGQWEGLRERMLAEGAEHLDTVPVVTARLAAVKGAPIADLVEPRTGRSRRMLTREQRLTWREALPADNELVASLTPGAPWGDPALAEISLEEEYAEDLGVGLGDVLRFDVQGVPFEFTVSSLRRVNWGSFRINFFLIAEPGWLEEAPHSRLAAARFDVAGEQRLQDALATTAPNVSVLQVRAIVETVRAALDKIGFGVSVLGGFSVIAGLVILTGAVSAGALRRSRETALLRTLGLTRRGVALINAVEDALVGLLAGGLGAAGAALLAWAMLDVVLELPFRPSAAVLLAAPLGAALLAVVAGALTGRRARSASPLAVLREA
ncbi:MAG: ABC transporter permease [Planctomycetota bacterium]